MQTNVFQNVHKVANYTLSWLLGAKREHGLDIDYVGLWNEKDTTPAYDAALRLAVEKSEVGNKTVVLKRLEHYSGSTNTPDPQGCQQHSSATPGELWADEEGSTFDGRSARCLARILNRNYISKCKTATFQWHLVSAFYSYLPWPRCGLAVANEPWSGAFEVTSPLWAVAHTTQFAPVGWRYAAHEAGVGMLKKGGSMVTRVSPDLKDFSIVIEKIDSSTSACGHGVNPVAGVHDEFVTVKLKGSFLEMAKGGNLVLHAWVSNLTSGSDFGENPPDDQLFQQGEDIRVQTNGVFKLWVYREHLITLTTLKTGQKGAVTSPPKSAFPMPYAQSFDEETAGTPPRLWYDLMGAWEIQPSPYGDANLRGKVMRQVVPVFPQCWGYMCESPTTLFGPSTFAGDISVSVDVRLEEAGSITFNPVGLNYSSIILNSQGKGKGTWHLGSRKQGSIDFSPDTWHSLTLRMLPDGSQDVTLNGKLLRKSLSLIDSTIDSTVPNDKGNERCEEDTFPLSTVGTKHLFLKPDRAKSAEQCRKACCRDENLCDIWQWDGTECQMGRAAGGIEKDTSGRWVGGRRWPLAGWHLKVRLSKYMRASMDNFHIYQTPMETAKTTNWVNWTKGNGQTMANLPNM